MRHLLNHKYRQQLKHKIRFFCLKYSKSLYLLFDTMAFPGISTDLERHISSIIVVVDIYPQMMEQMIINTWPPASVVQKVQDAMENIHHPFRKSLNESERKILKALANGYTKCDVSLMYKLIRHFYLVETPTKGWGCKPSPEDLNQGDDVERMKRSRNEILHRPRGSLSENERDLFFQESEEIARRIDKFIGSPVNGFEYRMQNLKSYTVTRDRYIQILERLNQLQESLRLQQVNVDLYYGEDIAVRLEPENVGEPNGVTICSLYMRDPNMDISRIIEILDKVRNQLNEGNYGIKFQAAENKCLAVHIEIENKCFAKKELLHKAVETFLQKLFKLTSLDRLLESPVAVVLVESDNTYEMDSTDDRYEDLDQSDNVLKLDVEVQNTVFQSGAHLYQHVNEFCNHIFHVANQDRPTNGSTLEVVITVDRNSEITEPKDQETHNKGVMVRSTPVCNVCNLNPATTWCIECDQRLCVSCNEHHVFSKGTQAHKTIPINIYQRIPENILKFRELCEEHNENLELFCIQHDCPCCRSCCVKGHSNCEGMMDKKTFIQNLKTSDIFKETEHFISEILDTIEEIRKNRTNNILSVHQQRQNVEKEISTIRAKINEHLDQLQETIMNELTELETNVQKQTKEVLTSLIAHEKQLNDHQTIMSSIKEHTEYLQTVLSIHRVIERDTDVIDKSIHDLLKTKAMNNTSLSYQIDNTIQNLPTNVPTFGKIIVEGHPCELTIFRRRNKGAQVMIAPSPSRSITLKKQETVNTRLHNLHGCLLLPDDRLVFASHDEYRIRSINQDRSEGFDTGKLSQMTFDITYIEDTNSIAITSGNDDSPCISIMDMENGHIKKTYPVESACYGIVHRNNTLIYCAKDKGLCMINLKDESESNILSEQMSSYAYVDACKDKLYFTNWKTHTVTCCDLHGNIQWRFKDENILIYPLGVTVDNDGNVYAVGWLSSNVIVITPDGQHGRQLVGEDEGVDRPQVLHYENSRPNIGRK